MKMSKEQDTTVNFTTEDGEVAVFKVIEETKNYIKNKCMIL